MLRTYAIPFTLVVALTGCGDDEEGGAPPPPKNTPAPAPATTPAAGAKTGAGTLKTYKHVEDLVSEEEGKTIRHAFKERDFLPDANGDNRDPFRSFVIVPNGVNAAAPDPGVVTEACKRTVAPSYSIRDLKLIGIALAGTKRSALMQDTKGDGHSLYRGDCVGREQARVKDIGRGYITFDVAPEGPDNGTARAPEERSVQLYPGDLPISTGDDQTENKAPGAPLVLPGANVAPPESPR
jgi:Tfp pilus assembly protein PilP